VGNSNCSGTGGTGTVGISGTGGAGGAGIIGCGGYTGSGGGGGGGGFFGGAGGGGAAGGGGGAWSGGGGGGGSSYSGTLTSSTFSSGVQSGNGKVIINGFSSPCVSGTRTAVTFSVNANPTVVATSNASLICTGQTASLTASGANTFTWNTTATTSIIAVSPSVTTSYTVTGTGANGCTNSSIITQSVSACTGILSNTSLNDQFNIYPNPSNGIIYIELETLKGEKAEIQILNTLGKILINETTTNARSTFNIANYPSGIYFVKVTQGNKQHTIKLIKD
jgi:hypothetical protein